MDKQQKISRFEIGDTLINKITTWIFIASFLIIPLFFIPSELFSFQFGKTYLIFLTVAVGTIAWILSRLKDGTVAVPRNWIYWLFIVIPFLMILSGIFSGSRALSFIGNGYEIGTVLFISALFLLAYLVSAIFISSRAIVYTYFAYIASFVIVILFHLLRLLVGPQFLSFGQFTSAVSSLVGGWNDLGIYIGSVVLFSFVTLELLKLQRWIRVAFWIVIGVSLLMLSVISFSTVWYILAAFSLIFFVYNFSFGKALKNTPESKTRTLPILSLVILIVSIIFILFKGNVYNTLSSQPFNVSLLQRFNVSNVEVRPSFVTTSKIAWQSVKQHPVFGVGPNRFLNQWLASKPADINNTLFWNTDFNFGFGFIPTLLITSGPLVFLAFVAFIALFIWTGFKVLFRKRNEMIRDYISTSSFLIALYLWIFAIIYVPSASLLFMTFFFTGIFLAAARNSGVIKESVIEFAHDPKTSFTSVLVFIVILLLILISEYSITRKFIADAYFNRALIDSTSQNNIDSAEANLIRALQFSENDTYYRALSQLYLVRLNGLLNNNQVSKDQLQSQFRTYLSQAQASAQAAQNYDKTNYQNWLALGNVLGSVVPLNVDGAYDGAKADYLEASRLNPTNPSILLSLAQLEVAHKDNAAAKTDISNALALKGDYTDAIFYLAQIQVGEGDVTNAIKSLEASTLISPNDAGLYFQLGLLRYNNKDFTGAASAFEQSLTILPDYANAKYFLGLAYAKINRTADALTLFNQLQASNPYSQEVSTIISNLKAGRDALAGLSSPQNEPEKSTTAPLKETSSADKNTDAVSQ